MGNSSSKDATDPKDPKRASKTSLEVPGPSLDSYPSLGKSDTKESSRSFRGFRSKIPGKKDSKGDEKGDEYTDSPRGSTAGLDEDPGNPEDEENKEMMDQMDGLPKKKTERQDSKEGKTNGLQDGVVDGQQPPPSPSMSGSLGGGHHSVDRAQKSGEVENVSEGPPGSGGLQVPSSTQKAGESILIKTPPPPKPRGKSKERRSLSKDRSRSKDRHMSTDGSMEIGALKPEQIDEMIQRLLDAGYAGKVTKSVCLKAPEIEAVCRSARELFLSQPALLELSPPVKIVGDVHGQYTDLLRLFEMCGFPPDANYLFLGDYVDRGKQSLETILLLMCYKLKFPENFFLLRGNHESANVTRVYGFFDECKRRTSTKIWKVFIDAFNALPIAAIVAGKIFCVHGGLSPALTHMDDIRAIARPTDVPDYGLLNDLLWSDPADIQSDWESNERGVSYCFGKSVILDFLSKHDFDLVCRAHMVVEDGYEFFADRILVTVFSAPNYCGEFDNYGAVMSVSGELLCSFELLKPLDSSQLKSHIKKSRNSRQNMLNSPPANPHPQSY